MSVSIGNVMCVLNESEFIEPTIRSIIPGIDQLVVIDQGSTDGTREILHELKKEFNFDVIDTRGQNFLNRGEQFFRNLCIDLCFCQWLMLTDGDEILGDGWEKVVRGFLECEEAEQYGVIRGNYWQMVGSSKFCTPTSPLRPETHERPLFFRTGRRLHAGEPMPGTMVHNGIEGIAPPGMKRLDFDCFHFGYAKTRLNERFERNITRGDWTQDEQHKASLLETAQTNPVSFLQDCIPVPFKPERLPASVRESRIQYNYDSETKRITGRA